jgi:hypothetical protein
MNWGENKRLPALTAGSVQLKFERFFLNFKGVFTIVKNIHLCLGISLLVLPGVALAAGESTTLLSQVPSPPKTIAAGAARWQEGHSDNGSQMGFDKAAVALLAKIDSLEKTSMTKGAKIGGESAGDIQAKMANLSQEEKMAYAMKLSQKMQADQMAAYTGADSKAMMQSSQNNAASVKKSYAGETAAKAMSDTDTEYSAKFESLLTQMISNAKACPTERAGGGEGPAPSCVKPLLAKYKADYTALTLKKMAKYAAIFADFKKSASEEMAGWQSDIDNLSDTSTDAAANDANRKRMMIYEDIKGLTIPADKCVDMAHDAATLNPWKACGGNCLQD